MGPSQDSRDHDACGDVQRTSFDCLHYFIVSVVGQDLVAWDDVQRTSFDCLHYCIVSVVEQSQMGPSQKDSRDHVTYNAEDFF